MKHKDVKLKPEVHRKVKVNAAKEGKTINDYLAELIDRYPE